MRLAGMLELSRVLGALWGGLPGPEVCSSHPRSVDSEAGASASQAVIAFVNVHVLPMDTERVLSSHTVLVEGGKITALGPAAQVKVPAGAIRIDGQGKYLIPGLGDMHNHKIYYVGNGTAENPIDAAALQASMFRKWLANGVTAVRTLEGPQIEHMAILQRALKETGPWPRLYLARGISASIKPKDVAAHVAASQAAGYRHIGTGLSLLAPRSSDFVPRSPDALAALQVEREILDSLIAASRRIGLPVSVHAHRYPFNAVLAVGITGGSFEHLSSLFYDTLGIWPKRVVTPRQPADLPLAQIRPLVAALKHAGVWVTPTMACMERVHVGVSGLPQALKALQDGGVGLLLSGTDGGEGTVQDELAAMVRAGLTPYQALLTGTRNVAQYFGILDSAGTISVRKRADLVLLEGNPLVDIRHASAIAGVMIDGLWLEQAALGRRPSTFP